MKLLASIAVACTTGVIALASFARAEDSAGLLGPWLTQDGGAVVNVAACGTALCGNIVWAAVAVDGKGHALCGEAILGDLVSLGTASWGKGWIFSPKTENKYPVALSLPADGKLRLHISAGLVSRDQTWTRPAAAVAPCTP
jgi:uncharacterized protein (DUF2147 family)